MSAKRPPVDLMALTSEQASPMPEASQRVAPSSSLAPVALRAVPKIVREEELAKTPNLEALAFKVSAIFRKRFRSRAVAADLKLNELLFEALDAWEEKRGLKK
jgi:hypothetical protein